jgi:hypothetical protein
MTGSGKTGLCVGMLEALAASGVPILAVDPKGDLSNLALVLKDLSPASFAPWVVNAEAAALQWREGLAKEGLGEPDLTAWRAAVDVAVLTPGSEAGIPVNVLSALTRAPASLAGDAEGLREYVSGAVSALLGLIGRECDVMTDPAAILLSNLLTPAFAAGRELPLEELIPAVVDPPFAQQGMFTTDAFLSRDKRVELALQLNTILASPAFAAWRTGVPLDVAAWLKPAEPGGRTPVRVLYLAHLDERQRMFFVTLLMHAVVAWSRSLPGSADLRALVYFDEVMGYLPPHPRNPPSKWPILTLMKQARAVGVGVMLVSQNPVDVDYKAMSNAATWLVGRLTTKQDRARVTDGLDAAGLGGVTDEQLASLPPRTFWVRTAGGSRVVTARHTLAYLRGPLTRREVALLGQRWAGEAAPVASTTLSAPPPLPEGLTPRWLSAEGAAELLGAQGEASELAADVVWRPALYARWTVQFDEADYIETESAHRLLWPADDAEAEPASRSLSDAWLLRARPAEGRYAPAPAWLADAIDVHQLRARWTTALRMSARHEGPERVLTAERDDVVMTGLVLVWVPVRSA